jgi:type IV pilus assembly protein PilY1
MGHFVRQLSAVAVMLFTALHSIPAQSQYTSDIDLYSGIPSQQDLPNVLIIVDNTANWNQVFDVEKDALKSTFSSLTPDRFRAGMAMFTQSGESPDGGFVLAGIRQVDSGYAGKLSNLVGSFVNETPNKDGHKGNNATVGLAMMEAYYYFAGLAPYASSGAAKADYANNPNGTSAEKAIHALAGAALASKSASAYNNAFAVGNCAPNYIIYLSNGPAGDNSSSTATASTRLNSAYSALKMTRPPEIVVSPNGQQSNVSDEWARFMKVSPQQITTYTIDVQTTNATKGQRDDWTALLKSMAASSGGEYFKVDATGGSTTVGKQISDAFGDIFNKIQPVNSVYASASLPVSVNARGTYLNQVFMGMFRPDPNSKPRWRGNLKQYKFGYDPTTDSLSLVDQNGRDAITSGSGFIAPNATSYWSHASTYWTNQPLGSNASSMTSDAPDGEIVEKGGIAQMIRESYATSQADRKILTCIGCAQKTNLATSTSTQFNSSNVSAGVLGASSDAERDLLVGWFRGLDNAGDEKGPGGGVNVRPSVHGDVLHSRPAVVNYGGSTGVVVYYGANDGLIRAINGNQTGAGAGQELWGFIPEEHLPRIKRLRGNTPIIRLSTTLMPSPSTTSDPIPRDYFADGPIGVYQKISKGVTEKVILFSAMRRGGRFLYALDVTNPAQPIYLWKKSNADIPVLGQTWSEPKVARLRGYDNPVLIMGAGYDAAAEDVSPAGTTTMGNAVLVLDAFDGSLVKKFDTERSVAADMSLVDSDYDGVADRAYAVDVGGNVYRLDFETTTSTAKDDWSIYKLASLAGASTRKFFYPPDVVLTRNFTALLMATGDREKPLATTSADRFFTLYDRNVRKGRPVDYTAVTADQLAAIGSDGDMDKGCYFSFATNGEKAVNAPVTAAGITYFSTNRPTPAVPGACTNNLGEAKVYSAPLFCKAPTFAEIKGGGLPPSPVVGVVSVSYIVKTADGKEETVNKQVPFIIGGPNAKNSGIEGSKVKNTVTPTRKRKYWYLENAR